MPWQSVADYKAASQTAAHTPSQPASAKPNPTPSAPPAPSDQTPAAEPAPPPKSASNPAVQRCCSAYQQALAATEDSEKAKDAYKSALPFLTDRASILDFMACVTHGMVIKVFWNDEGPKLISAAKATLAALPREPATIPEHAARAAGRPTNGKRKPVLEN